MPEAIAQAGSVESRPPQAVGPADAARAATALDRHAHAHDGPDSFGISSPGGRSDLWRLLRYRRHAGPRGRHPPRAITGRASVVDGDTIEIHGQHIRLSGIDAPESGQVCFSADDKPWRCGQQAALALANRIGGVPVTCRPTGTDPGLTHEGL